MLRHAVYVSLLAVLSVPAFSAGRSVDISPACNIAKDIGRDALNLGDVVELAMCNNTSTRSAWLSAQIGETGFAKSISSYFPNITATGSVSDSKNYIVKPSEYDMPHQKGISGGLNLSWLLFDFGAREAGVVQAYSSMNSAQFKYNSVLQQIAYEAISAYYQVLSGIEALAAADMNEQATKKSFELASKKFVLGMNSKADQLQAETAFVQAQLDKTKQEQVLKNAKASLARLLGLPPGLDYSVAESKGDVSSRVISDNVDDIIRTALKKHPDLLASESDVSAARAALFRSGASWLPSVSARAGVTSGFDDDYETQNKNYSASINVSMPIFTGFEDTYSYRTAGLQYDQARESYRSARQNVELSVVNAYNDYQTSLKSLSLAHKMYESAIENEAVASGSYQAGKGDIIRLMEAQSRLIMARKERISAHYGVSMAKIMLLRAAGELSLQSLNLPAKGAEAPGK
ncbi:MAG: TolC family protein [Rickettsiales bacterium]|jgi:TolC family type I secretion outer membrane protein|nr:TolC family protein [Rickettsiales bacterium]